MELKGIIKFIGESEAVTPKFTKREMVITTEEQYPQHVKFDFVNAKAGLLDALNEGEKVNIHFNIRGNEWNGRHFVSLQGWKVDGANASDSKSNKKIEKSVQTNYPTPQSSSLKKPMVKVTEDFDSEEASSSISEEDELIF